MARLTPEAPRSVATPFESSVLRRLLVAFVVVKVFLLIVAFDVTGTLAQPFDLVKAAVSRALLWPMVLLVALALARHGSGIVPRTRLHLAPLALVVATALAVPFAEDRYLALFGDEGRYLGLTTVLDLAALYGATAISFRTRRDWAALALALGVATAASMLYAYAQYAGADPLAWELKDRGRPFGTIGNADTFGHLLSLAFGLGLGVLLAPLPLIVRIGGAALAAAVLAEASFVATRGTFLAVIGALVAVPVVLVRVQGATRRVLAVAGGLLLVTTVVLAALVAFTFLGERIRSTAQLGPDVNDRVVLYATALRSAAERPILGWGPENFKPAFVRHRPAASDALYGPGITADSAHSWILQAAVTTGALGLAAFLATFAAWWLGTWRLLRRSPDIAVPLALAGAAYWTHATVSVGTLGVDWWPWVSLGVVASFAPRGAPERPGRMPRLAVSLAAVVALALAATPLPALAANREALRARHANDIGLLGAADAAAAAVRGDPGRASYWNELGRAEYAAGRWAAAAEAFGEAARGAPHEARFRSNRAIALLQLAAAGDAVARSAALADARAAVATDPNVSLTHAVLAEVAAAAGEPIEALSEAARSLELYPGSRVALAGIVARAAAAAEPTGARPMLERIVAAAETAAFRAALADVAFRGNDAAAARANARRALELDPNEPTAQRVLRALGS